MPKLYLALGISCTFQHMVDLMCSKMIVATNKDAKAPIFADADYVIVDDILKVVRTLAYKNDLKF